jgi:hypothetical protein
LNYWYGMVDFHCPPISLNIVNPICLFICAVISRLGEVESMQMEVL